MYTNANVRPANDTVWSATGTTRALTEGNGASETAYGRPHAPRSAMPNNAALTGLHFDISSTSKLSGATNRSRISDCSRISIMLLERIRASCRQRIGYSPAEQDSEIRRPVWSRVRISQPSYHLPASSVNPYSRRQLAAYCRPKPTQLRSKTSVDCTQTKSISGPVPRPVHHVALTTLQSTPAITHFRSSLPEAQTTAALTKSATINP
jgi:hypothetical protein